MAFADFADIYGDVIREARRNASVTADVTAAKQAVNRAYVRIQASGDDWSFLEVEGTQAYAAGTDIHTFADFATSLSVDGIYKIQSLVNNTEDFPPLRPVDWVELERLAWASQAATESRGTPWYWAQFASKVRVYPNPDVATTFQVLALQTDNPLTADNNTFLIPTQWCHAVLVPGAVAILLRQRASDLNEARARNYDIQFEKAMTDMREALASARTPQLSLYAPTWGSDLPGSYGAGY